MRYPPEPPDDLAPFPPALASAPPRLADPHGMATRHMHIKLNEWEHGQLARLARRDCVPMTTALRRVLRAHLFAEMKR